MPNDSGLSRFAPSHARRGGRWRSPGCCAAAQDACRRKLFYDEEGCRLFYRITELPEYYLTRTEHALLTRGGAAGRCAALTGPTVLVEYGASDETKASCTCCRRVEAGRGAVFAPMCRSTSPRRRCEAMRERLARAAAQAGGASGGRRLHGADRTAGVGVRLRPRLGFFPGSTIGNLDPGCGQRFLRAGADHAGPGRAIPGRRRSAQGSRRSCCRPMTMPQVSPRRSIATCWCGSTARRARISTRRASPIAPCGTMRESRIEMHLVSRRDQVVHVAGHADPFRRGRDASTPRTATSTRRRRSWRWRRGRLAMPADVDRSGALVRAVPCLSHNRTVTGRVRIRGEQSRWCWFTPARRRHGRLRAWP